MLSEKGKILFDELNVDDVPLGLIKKTASEIKKDHQLAMELWQTKSYYPRLLSVLIVDKKELDESLLNQLSKDLEIHNEMQRNQIVDWLLANQLIKSKKTKLLVESWQNNPSPALRRTFWFYQGRLRWTGKIPIDNAKDLLDVAEANLSREVSEVQWAMNFCVGWIGVYDTEYRERCMELGKKAGLYKDQKVSKGCTPNYLPEFIRIEAAKLK